jgi:hypothetical protein
LKLLKTDGDNLVFHLERREKDLLLELLKLYPLIPVSHFRVSNKSDSAQARASQKLLEEALAEHRQENRRALAAMLSEPNRFQETPGGSRLQLKPQQVEWLLQVINDVRVGSWLNLGSPDQTRGKRVRLTEENAQYLWAMELAQHFEHALLVAMEAQ